MKRKHKITTLAVALFTAYLLLVMQTVRMLLNGNTEFMIFFVVASAVLIVVRHFVLFYHWLHSKMM